MDKDHEDPQRKPHARPIPCWHASAHLHGLRDHGTRLLIVTGEDAEARQRVLEGWLPYLYHIPWRDQLVWVDMGGVGTTEDTAMMQWGADGPLHQLRPPQPLDPTVVRATLTQGASKKRKKGRHIVVVTDTRRDSALLTTVMEWALLSTVGLCVLSVPSLTALTDADWGHCGAVVVVPQPLRQPHPSAAVCVLAARWPQSVVTVQALEQHCAQRTQYLVVMVWVPTTTQWYWTAIVPPPPPALAHPPQASPPPSPRTEVTRLLEAVAEAHPAWAARCAAAVLQLRHLHGQP